jgi:hypothetical protein
MVGDIDDVKSVISIIQSVIITLMLYGSHTDAIMNRWCFMIASRKKKRRHTENAHLLSHYPKIHTKNAHISTL